MRGETEAAPPPLCIREKWNTAHKVTDARSGDRTNIGVMFDAPPPAFPFLTNTNGKNYQKDDGGFYFVTALLEPPNYGGSEYFPLARPPPLISTTELAPYTETRGKRISRRTPRLHRLLLFTLACWSKQRLWLLSMLKRQRPREGSSLGSPHPCPWFRLLLKAQRKRLLHQYRYSSSGRPPCRPLPPPLPAGFHLLIGHTLLNRYQNVPITRQRQQSVITFYLAFPTTTWRMVGVSRSPGWYMVKIWRLGNEFTM